MARAKSSGQSNRRTWLMAELWFTMRAWRPSRAASSMLSEGSEQVENRLDKALVTATPVEK